MWGVIGLKIFEVIFRQEYYKYTGSVAKKVSVEFPKWVSAEVSSHRNCNICNELSNETNDKLMYHRKCFEMYGFRY